jgi:hypothetical protein
MNRRFKKADIHVGMRIQKLVVLEILTGFIKKQRNRNGKVYTESESGIKCQCDCGRIKIIRLDSLAMGTKSCGCEMRRNKEYIKYDQIVTNIYGRYKKGASQRQLDFNIPIEQFDKLIKDKCHYCGTAGSNTQYRYNGEAKRRRERKQVVDSLQYNGLDRIDPKLGYELNNVVPCCTMCNWMKLDFSLDEFKDQIKTIYKHLNLKDET